MAIVRIKPKYVTHRYLIAYLIWSLDQSTESKIRYWPTVQQFVAYFKLESAIHYAINSNFIRYIIQRRAIEICYKNICSLRTSSFVVIILRVSYLMQGHQYLIWTTFLA